MPILFCQFIQNFRFDGQSLKSLTQDQPRCLYLRSEEVFQYLQIENEQLRVHENSKKKLLGSDLDP